MDNPLHFGNMAYVPEPLQVLPATGTLKEVKPRFRHALSAEQEAAMLADVEDTRPIKRFYPHPDDEVEFQLHDFGSRPFRLIGKDVDDVEFKEVNSG